jgi:hypothetical protein
MTMDASSETFAYIRQTAKCFMLGDSNVGVNESSDYIKGGIVLGAEYLLVLKGRLSFMRTKERPF